MNEIKNKVIIIMGASSGIGAATTRLLAKNGARLVIAARRADKIEELAKEVEGEVYPLKADVTNRQQVQAVVDLAIEKFGKIDVMFNNAGIMPQGNLSKLQYNQWQKMLEINIMGVLNGIGAVLPVMQKQQDGLIITTDSVAGHVVYPGSAVYNGTKYAVRAIMEGLRQEELENGIHSTIISPGMVATELFKTVGDSELEASLQATASEQEKSLTPENVAEAVLYAIQQPKNVTISEVLLRPAKQRI